MRRVVLFIAMSLDGYIADSEGGVDWLKGQDENAENVDVYSDFVKDVDTVVMGWNTYHQIVTELSPSEWIYAEEDQGHYKYSLVSTVEGDRIHSTHTA